MGKKVRIYALFFNKTQKLTKSFFQRYAYRLQSKSNFCRDCYLNLPISEFRPKVAVVAPIYVRTPQQRKEVLELISSLANQTYKVEQVILVDDCSPMPWYLSSATGQNEENLVKLPAHTRLVRRPKNHGPAAARSLGLGLAIAEHQAQVSNYICCSNDV